MPYFDWARLPDEKARQNYLKTGLAAIVKSARKASKVEVVSEDDRDEFSALKVAELRRLCEARGLESRVKRGLDARATLIAAGAGAGRFIFFIGGGGRVSGVYLKFRVKNPFCCVHFYRPGARVHR